MDKEAGRDVPSKSFSRMVLLLCGISAWDRFNAFLTAWATSWGFDKLSMKVSDKE
jgi:hypothetical protein